MGVAYAGLTLIVNRRLRRAQGGCPSALRVAKPSTRTARRSANARIAQHASGPKSVRGRSDTSGHRAGHCSWTGAAAAILAVVRVEWPRYVHRAATTTAAVAARYDTTRSCRGLTRFECRMLDSGFCK
jgi:hypothetical protein